MSKTTFDGIDDRMEVIAPTTPQSPTPIAWNASDEAEAFATALRRHAAKSLKAPQSIPTLSDYQFTPTPTPTMQGSAPAMEGPRNPMDEAIQQTRHRMLNQALSAMNAMNSAIFDDLMGARSRRSSFFDPPPSAPDRPDKDDM